MLYCFRSGIQVWVKLHRNGLIDASVWYMTMQPADIWMISGRVGKISLLQQEGRYGEFKHFQVRLHIPACNGQSKSYKLNLILDVLRAKQWT